MLIGASRHEMSASHDFRDPEGKGDGRVLQDNGIFIGPARNGKAQGLRQDDMQHRLGVTHAKGTGRSELAFRERNGWPRG